MNEVSGQGAVICDSHSENLVTMDHSRTTDTPRATKSPAIEQVIIAMELREMRMKIVVRMFLGVIALGGATACFDSRCSIENCRRMLDCTVQFEAEPAIFAKCALLDGGSAPFSASDYCPAACNTVAGGELAQCVAGLSAQCKDASSSLAKDALISNQCFGDGGVADTSSDMSCIEACRSKRKACDDKCPMTTYKACMDCSAACGLEFAACGKACR